MKITINQTAADLDPHATTNDPDQSLVNYIRELTAAIHRKYPDAVVYHNDIVSIYPFTVNFDPGGDIASDLERISKRVYADGNFWE